MISTIDLQIHGSRLLTTSLYRDSRGMFEISWERELMETLELRFSPTNAHHSYNSAIHTLRGLHFQKHPFGQTKMVSCVSGKALDIIVDLRRDSASFGSWQGIELEAASGRSIFIPAGCAHGFVTLAPNTTIAYLIEGSYNPTAGRVLKWNDKKLDINWTVTDPILSEKDATAPGWTECDF